MAGRAEHMQSHQFARQRVIAALAVREADPVASPVRRSAGTAFAGVMLAVVALAAVAAYGVLRPGDSTSWRDGRSVIIEKETGARFVYRAGVLHPTLNYASALLILGSAQPATVIVSHASLAGVPRGVPLGIPGAPDPLPAPADLLTGAWTLCSRAPASSTLGGDPSTAAESLLVVGAVATPDAGTTTPVDDGHAVLARVGDADYHLLWRGRRYAIRTPGVVLTALSLRQDQAVPFAPAVLNALPIGSDLAPLPVADRGRPSAFAGHRVGEVVTWASLANVTSYGLVRPDGIAEITQLQANLLLSDPANGRGFEAVKITPGEYSNAPHAATLVPQGEVAPPETTPAPASPGAPGGVCASFVDAKSRPGLIVHTGRPIAAGETRGAPAGVDWVAVQPGRGAIVDSRASATDPSGLLAVVSDLGVLFPVPSSSVLDMLGYAGAERHPMPSALVALLPRGNALDPAAAVVAPG